WSASTRAIFMVSGRLQADRAAGFEGEALERVGVHVGPRSQDEPVDPGGRIGIARRLVRNVVAGRRHADLEPAEPGGARVLLARLAPPVHEPLRLVHGESAPVTAVTLAHGRAAGQR